MLPCYHLVGLLIHRVIEQVGQEVDGDEVLPAIAAGGVDLDLADGDAFEFVDLPEAAHLIELLLVFSGQLVAEQMPVGLEIPAHPAGLDLKKDIGGDLEEMFGVKGPVRPADLGQSLFDGIADLGGRRGRHRKSAACAASGPGPRKSTLQG